MLNLHTCKIARRGKGARGTVEVQTFGIPEIDEKTGIAKGWDYSSFADKDTAELVVFLSQFGDVNAAMLRGFDVENKSAAMKAQNEVNVLSARIIAENLAEDKDTAKNIASTILSTIRKMAQLGVESENLPTIDFLLSKRAAVVDKERKDKGMAPRLVKPVVLEPEESDDDSSDIEIEN